MNSEWLSPDSNPDACQFQAFKKCLARLTDTLLPISALFRHDLSSSLHTLKSSPDCHVDMELDPTKNDDLHHYIWNKLMKRIEVELARIENEKLTKLTTESNDGESINVFESSSMESQTANKSEAGEDDVDISPKSLRKIDALKIAPKNKHGKGMRRLLKLVCRAFLNPLQIPWDIEEFYREHVLAGRDKKRIKFPNPLLGAFSDPLTLVDKKGRIVLWYLPDLLSKDQQASIKQSTVVIEPLLKKSVQKQKLDKPTPNWRTHDVNFVTHVSGNLIEPGAVTFSAGWLGQGHTLEPFPILPSLNLREQHLSETSNWLDMTKDVEQFMNLTLSLIHPDLFECGLEMLRILRKTEGTEAIAQRWQSIYTGIAVICNRISPAHRDSKGNPEWFDTLLSYSETGASPRLRITDIGLDLEYSSGTVVGFCGSVLKHSVESWGMGDRICYAHFMRESVRNRLNVNRAGWVYQDKYLPIKRSTSQEIFDMVVDLEQVDKDSMNVN